MDTTSVLSGIYMSVFISSILSFIIFTMIYYLLVGMMSILESLDKDIDNMKNI